MAAPEEYRDSLTGMFAYDPVRLAVAEDPDQLLFDRKSFEKMWETEHNADQPLETGRLIPQTHLRHQMRRYLHQQRHNRIADVISQDYTLPLEENGMFRLLHSIPRKHVTPHDWKVTWKKLNLLRLCVQCNSDNRMAFREVGGFGYLFQVAARYIDSDSQYENAQDVYTELGRIVDVVGLTSSDLRGILSPGINRVIHILLRVPDRSHALGLFLRICRQLFYDCLMVTEDVLSLELISRLLDILGQHFKQPDKSRIANQDLYNATALLMAAYSTPALIPLMNYDQINLVSNIAILILSRFHQTPQPHYNNKNMSVAFEHVLYLINQVAKYVLDFLPPNEFDILVKGTLQLVLNPPNLDAPQFNSSHLEYLLNIAVEFYKQQPPVNADVFRQVLQSDVIDGYSLEVKGLLKQLLVRTGASA